MELNYIYEPHLSQSSVFFYQFLLPIIENVLYFLHIPPSLPGKVSCVSLKKLFAGDLRISMACIKGCALKCCTPGGGPTVKLHSKGAVALTNKKR